MTDSPASSQRRAARSRICAAGTFGFAVKSNSFEGDLFLETGAADPAGERGGFAAADLVLAEDLQELEVAECPGSGLCQSGVEGLQHAGEFQRAQRVPQCGVEDGHGCLRS